MGRILFWVIIIYVLYKFITGFVLPVAGAAKKMKASMKKMNEELEKNNMNQQAPQPSATPQNKSEKPKGDYIDFEEVK